jgi:hypothetical protein
METISRIHELLIAEKQFAQSDDIGELEFEWEELVESSEGDEWQLLVEYNRFRLRNLPRLQRSRPAVLLGFVNNSHFPNMHTMDLLKIADVVSLTNLDVQDQEIDRLHYSLTTDTIDSLVSRLPSGFEPTFYWDSQAVHGHPHPVGLSNAPFPTIASICHVQHSAAARRLVDVFDYIIPVGRCFDKFFEGGKAEILKMPFGLNWASMHHLFSSEPKLRDIDVSLTFSPVDASVYGGLRKEVVKKIEELERRWKNKFRIVARWGLNKNDYFDLLQRSKISVNVVGFNGPYNYRSCEILNSGALLFQANVTSHGVECNHEELFRDGEHFISFSIEDLEENLLELLTDEDRLTKIAENGKAFLESTYSYEKLFKQLIARVRNDPFPDRVNPQGKICGDFDLCAFLWEQVQDKDLRSIGTGLLCRSLQQFENNKFYSNILALLPEILDGFGFPFLQNLVGTRNQELANSFNSLDMKQMAFQLYNQQLDHAALCYNFLSIAIERDWIESSQCLLLVEQAFRGKAWDAYDPSWLLRYPIKDSVDGSINSSNFKYENFDIPLLRSTRNAEKWVVYRDFLLMNARNK